MEYHPPDSLSYCEVDERFVFLDVAHDRYFCLGADAEDAFRTALADAGDSGDADGPAATANRPDRLMSAIVARQPQRCDAGDIPMTSLLDSTPRPPSILTVLSALVRLARVRRTLRRGGFAALIAGLRAAKARPVPVPAAERARIERLALDFERTARFTRSHDQCLPRAITLARMAVARGMDVELVIGVQLRPFAAHAWVRSGSTLLNEHVDAARIYTPILVV